MIDSFETTTGHLAERLLAAIEAGEATGGEMGPVHSAALLVYDTQTWPIASLRVDWDGAPIAKLRAVWDVYQPQMADYILRAVKPTGAPSYGVPGNE